MASFPNSGFTPPGIDPNAGMSEQEKQMVKAMQTGMESCVGKSIMAGVMGGGLGAMFGLFMASMRYDTPMSQPLPVQTPAAPSAKAPPSSTTGPIRPTGTIPTWSTTHSTTPALSSLKPSTATLSAVPITSTAATPAMPSSVPLTDLPLRQQLKTGLKDMYQSSKSSGKNFAVVGAVFSGSECAVEGLRAKNDIWNGVWGGCITGGVLARKAGPQAVAVGCAGFAAFSAAIDAYMRMPEDERSRPIA